MSQRKIIHIDMDCFYAAIEMRDNPSLRNKPVAVGGDAQRRGVLCTCNYEARKFGLHSAMSSSMALRKCPDLIIVPVDMAKYKAVSQRIQNIFTEFTDRIEPLSLDEVFLDVSDSPLHQGSATLIAKAIRDQIFTQEQLTASAGIAPNKFLAKVASDWNKPNGQFVIAPNHIDAFMKQLPVKKIFGVGKVTAARLEEQNIKTCADLQQWSLLDLVKQFGSFGEHLYQLSRGIDEREVQTERQRKSLSVEETFEHDLMNSEQCLEQFPALYHQFSRRLENFLRNEQAAYKSIFVKIKYNDFNSTTIQESFQRLNVEVFKKLFIQRYAEKPAPVRLLGIGVQFKETSIEEQDQMEIPFADVMR